MISLPQLKYNLNFRFVDEEDAEFILSLRNDIKLSKFISPTSSSISDQVNWIKEYKKKENNNTEFYIICLTKDGKTKLGLNRLYNIKDNSFEIGSWLFKKSSNNNASVLADLFCRTLLFDIEKFERCVFEVRKKNKSVVRYHKMFNPTLIDEDALNYYYELTRQKFYETKNKLIKMLQNDK